MHGCTRTAGFSLFFGFFRGFGFCPFRGRVASRQSPVTRAVGRLRRNECNDKEKRMNKGVIPELETERLLLRQVIIDDLEQWAKGVFADPDAMRYMPKREMTPLARAERAMNNFNRYWTQHGLGAWGVTDKKNGQFLGSCYLEPPEDSGTGDVELGYDLAKPFWGQGIATEAARAAVRFSFENNNLERIVAIVVPENIGSWRVLEHIGFIYEKKAHIYDVDVVYYAITREQFQPGDSFYQVRMPKP